MSVNSVQQVLLLLLVALCLAVPHPPMVRSSNQDVLIHPRSVNCQGNVLYYDRFGECAKTTDDYGNDVYRYFEYCPDGETLCYRRSLGQTWIQDGM